MGGSVIGSSYVAGRKVSQFGTKYEVAYQGYACAGLGLGGQQSREVGRERVTKEEISKRYLEGARVDKPLAPQRSAVVIGAWPEGNIGHAIYKTLNEGGFVVRTPTKRDVDVRSAGSLETYFNSREVDTLILANGYTHLDWFEDYPTSEIYQVMSQTLTGSIVAAQKFVQATMFSPHRKYLVFVGSMAYRAVLTASAPYCAAKAGLAHLVQCLGWELTPKGYRVFGVHPSNVEGTPMTEETINGIMRYRGISRVDAENYWGAINLMPDWLHPEDVAEAVYNLVSGRADYQSGSNIELRGGQR